MAQPGESENRMRGMISRSRGKQIIGKMRGRRIGVFGDWMLDRYVWGTAERISPEAAVPVVNFLKESDCLGGAGNVAANLAALGASVEGFGVVGKDEAGASLRQRMREWKLSGTGLLEIPSRKTTLKTRIIARHQQIVRIDREDKTPISSKHEASLLKCIAAALPKLDAVVISDYDKGVMSDSLTMELLAACARRKVPVFAGPKLSRLATYPGAILVALNRKEAEFLNRKDSESLEASVLDTDLAVELAARKLLEHFSSTAVMITRGEQGLSLFERNARAGFHIAALSRERPVGVGAISSGRQVFDVTGAGDTVLAVLALAAAAGASLREAALLGNAAAGVVVGKLGTATLTREELESVLWGD
jgi:D-beta-D-heptose 7-phosphate kinase/D-beta-D-heptose 1-phosphate adenosyltransferase